MSDSLQRTFYQVTIGLLNFIVIILICPGGGSPLRISDLFVMFGPYLRFEKVSTSFVQITEMARKSVIVWNENAAPIASECQPVRLSVIQGSGSLT